MNRIKKFIKNKYTISKTRNLKKFTPFLLTILVLLIILPNLVNLQVEAGWFNNDWYYRKQINISSHSSLETNVYVTVPSFDATDTTKFQADCGDLRFVKENGETLPYYVVDCDATAEIHVLFDSLQAGASKYYMYYGNPTVDNGFELADFATPATGLGTQTLASEEKGTAPVAHWKFDQTGGTTLYDSTSNQFNGTLTNMDPGGDWITSSNCKLNNCLDFDGSNDYVEMPYNPKLNSPVFSVSTWVYPTGGNGSFRSIYTSRRGVAGVPPYTGYAIYAGSDNFWQVYLGNGSTTWTTLSSSNAVVLNQWTHITVTYDASNIRLYINSRLVATQSASVFVPNTSHPSRIGAGATESATPQYYFQGMIDNLKVYDYAINQSQILNDMSDTSPLGSSTFTVLPTPLIHYKLDEQTGQATNNSISSSYPGTLGASGAASTDDPTWNNPDSCRTNGCISFDGGDFISTDYTTAVGTASVSFSGWFKAPNNDQAGMIFSKRQVSSPFTQISLMVAAACNGDPGQFLIVVDLPTRCSMISIDVADDKWHHFVYVRTSSSISVYLDGILVSTNISGGTSNATNTDNLRVGDGNGFFRFNGAIDEFKFYTTALTTDQVKLDYNASSALSVGVTSNTEAANLVGGAGNPPISEWKLDENTGLIAGDTSINSNNLTLNSDTKWVPGKVGSALQFDGVDDNATAPNSATLNIGTSDFTIEAWVKGNNMQNNDIIVGKSDGGACSTTYGYLFGVFDSLYPSLYFCTTNGSHAIVQGQQALVDGQWYHLVVAVDRDSAANTKMYINGIPVTTTTANLTSHTGSITNTLQQAIGSESDNDFNWDGQIDQVRIYNYQRTQSQIAYSFDRGGPITWFKMNEYSGSTVNDYTGRGNNASMVNMDPTTDWLTGSNCIHSGTCLDLDGSNDRLVVPGSSLYNVKDSFSLSAWVYPRSYASCVNPDYTDMVIVKGNDTTVGTFYLSICNGGNASFVLRINGSTSRNAVAPVGSVPLNTWTHITGTYDGTSARIYVNGRLVGSNSYAYASIPDVLSDLWIGANNNPSFLYQFNGRIDDVRIYNYPLSSSQAANLFNNDSSFYYGE